MPSALLLAHLLGVAVFVGSTVLLAMLIPAIGKGSPTPVERRARYASVLRIYSPLTVASLGVVVMTGAWSITPYKEALGPEYFLAIGSRLAGKLGLAFFIVMFGIYVCMGFGLRLVRACDGAAPVTEPQLKRQVQRMQFTVWLTLALTAWAMWIALGLGVPLPVA
jgi:uncharacterized membrane protein